jgi:WXG100 family type VII secretion target
MSIQLDLVHLSRAADDLVSRASDMASRRAQIEASVESLLSHWHGEAARRFGDFWEEWRDSADVVIDGLSTGVAAVRHSGVLLTSADASSGDAHARMQGRLG